MADVEILAESVIKLEDIKQDPDDSVEVPGWTSSEVVEPSTLMSAVKEEDDEERELVPPAAVFLDSKNVVKEEEKEKYEATPKQLQRPCGNIKQRQKDVKKHQVSTGGGPPHVDVQYNPLVKSIAPQLLGKIDSPYDSDGCAFYMQLEGGLTVYHQTTIDPTPRELPTVSTAPSRQFSTLTTLPSFNVTSSHSTRVTQSRKKNINKSGGECSGSCKRVAEYQRQLFLRCMKVEEIREEKELKLKKVATIQLEKEMKLKKVATIRLEKEMKLKKEADIRAEIAAIELMQLKSI